MKTSEILERLDSVEERNGYWMALCPAHNDHNPSLSIKEGDSGKPLVYCHAGCSYEQIMAELRDEVTVRIGPRSKPTKVWQVRNASGELKGLHLRFDKPDGDKECRWKRPTGEWGLNGTPLHAMPLYRSEYAGDWPEDVPVIVVEGETAADALAAVYPATLGTVTGAGSTPGLEALEVLRSKRVILWPDNDEEGRAHMEGVAEALDGVAAEVRIFRWADAPPKGDAADHPAVLSRSKEEFGELLDAMAAAPLSSVEVVPDGSKLLHNLVAYIRRYVVLTYEQTVLIVLWIIHTHAMGAADTTPYLHIRSVEKRSGKTRLLEVLSLLVARAWLTGRVTAAVLIRKVAAETPALLLDESDAAFKGDKEYSETLRGVLNSGFRRGGVASLCVG